MLLFLQLNDAVPNVSAVEASQNLGIYWDAKCINKVSSINWGVMSPGQSKKTVVYVRNEGSSPILLDLSTGDYNPTNASTYISFSWDCSDRKLDANQTVKITQDLQISSRIKGINNFSFNLIFTGEKYIPGDIDRNGGVDLYDAMLFAAAYNSTPQDTTWNIKADFDEDGIVSILDAIILNSQFP
jgi:hypothetical protein